MSPYSETLECAVSLELILLATMGHATHWDICTDTCPRSPSREGRQQVPASRLPLVVSATVRGAASWWTALLPDTDTLNIHSGTGSGQPPRSAATPGLGLSTQDADVRQAQQQWGPTWRDAGDMRRAMHTHMVTAHSYTHRLMHPMSHAHTQSQPHSFTDSHITQIHIIITKQINTQTQGACTHRDTLRYLQGDAHMFSDTHTHSYMSSPTQTCACTYTHKNTRSPGI